MTETPPPTKAVAVTDLLRAWSAGHPGAAEELLPLVYRELRVRAARHLRRERAGHTLSPTALVNEVYLRLCGQERVGWQNRSHFFGVAAKIMRRVLLDHARRVLRIKRGGAWRRLTLDPALLWQEARDVDLVALDSALEELAQLDAQQAQIVELRYFAGLSVEEAAEVVGVSASTVKREWASARAWLYRRLCSAEPREPEDPGQGDS
jgi:RNA polymerase sigma factor (TIGR02999 family)